MYLFLNVFFLILIYYQVWGEELHTGPLPRNSVEDAERASRQLDDQVGQEGFEWILDREGRACMQISWIEMV